MTATSVELDFCRRPGNAPRRFGLTRMLLGYAMDSREGEWQSVCHMTNPAVLIAELVGNLASLLMQPQSPAKRRGGPAAAAGEWLPVCRDLLNDFFLPDEIRAALALIEQQWLAVIDSGLEAQYGEQVPLTLLRDELAQRLDQQPSGSASAFLPARSISPYPDADAFDPL